MSSLHAWTELLNLGPRCIEYFTWEGLKPDVAGPMPSVESVSNGHAFSSAGDLLFRDPQTFKAGTLHDHVSAWESIALDILYSQDTTLASLSFLARYKYLLSLLTGLMIRTHLSRNYVMIC